MALDVLGGACRDFADDVAIVHHDHSSTYRQLAAEIAAASRRLAAAGIGPGAVVALEADYSPAGIAALLALFASGAIAVPLAPSSQARHAALRGLAQAEWRIAIAAAGAWRIEATGHRADHALYAALRGDQHAGLVLFTSGSSGEPKASVHDVERLLRKYHTRRQRVRTLLFLLYDHIGGVDTLLQALSNGSAAIIPADRSPEGVCLTIERHRVEVLPAAPSFLTMLLLSEAHRRHDLSSLRYITYGAEVMPQATLDRLAREFPDVTLLQKYGITEVGTLRSKSRANDSLWVKLGGEGFATRVVDGMLEIKAESSILGYLNAPAPFTADGWFITGDAVEVDGEYLRILGRASDLINVGGRKVYPAEVEGVILELAEIREAAVFGEPHPFTGHVVMARVTARDPASEAGAIERRVRDHCRARLEPYKVPVRVHLSADLLHTERQKTTRG